MWNNSRVCNYLCEICECVKAETNRDIQHILYVEKLQQIEPDIKHFQNVTYSTYCHKPLSLSLSLSQPIVDYY